MGEYANEQLRREVMGRHGFDPGVMYGEDLPRSLRPTCKKCSKKFRSADAVADHMRDKHKETQA